MPSELEELARVRRLVASGAAQTIRIGSGISLRELGRTVGVGPATILRWERGDRSPKGERALAYGRALDDLAKAGQ